MEKLSKRELKINGEIVYFDNDDMNMKPDGYAGHGSMPIRDLVGYVDGKEKYTAKGVYVGGSLGEIIDIEEL